MSSKFTPPPDDPNIYDDFMHGFYGDPRDEPDYYDDHADDYDDYPFPIIEPPTRWQKIKRLGSAVLRRVFPPPLVVNATQNTFTEHSNFIVKYPVPGWVYILTAITVLVSVWMATK